MGLLKNVEIDLAQFTALLIYETFEAMMSSSAQQADKVREMQQAALLPIEDFISTYMTEQAIDHEEKRIFGPSSSRPGLSAVQPGEPYSPTRGNNAEVPPIYARCGVLMRRGDYIKSDDGAQISAAGSRKIRNAIALGLGRRMQDHIKTLKDAGVPRLLIDSGRISARLAVRMEEREAGDLGAGKRIVVRPLSMRNPEVLRIKADLAAEIEIHFRTIT